MFFSATKYNHLAAEDTGCTAQEREIATHRAQRIEERFTAHPELEQYRDVIFYDWSEGDEHLEWIALAPIDEIMDWANSIEEETHV